MADQLASGIVDLAQGGGAPTAAARDLDRPDVERVGDRRQRQVAVADPLADLEATQRATLLGPDQIGCVAIGSAPRSPGRLPAVAEPVSETDEPRPADHVAERHPGQVVRGPGERHPLGSEQQRQRE